MRHYIRVYVTNEFHALMNHLMQNYKTLVIKQVQTTKKQVLFSYLNHFYTFLLDKQKLPQLTHRSERQVRCGALRVAIATGHVNALELTRIFS